MEELVPHSQHLGDGGNPQTTEREGHEETRQLQEKRARKEEMVSALLWKVTFPVVNGR